MIERLFFPDKVKRILQSWISTAIQRYVEWLMERRYAPDSIDDRVPVLIRFGEFARRRGVHRLKELPGHVDAFVAHSVRRCARRTTGGRRYAAQWARTVVEQMLRLAVPGFRGRPMWPKLRWPFRDQAPGFLDYLQEERGLSPATISLYGHHLRKLEDYLADVGATAVADLSPARINDFLVERSRRVGRRSVAGCAAVLRGFLRFARREGLMTADLARSVDRPQEYRLATIPRSISWEQAGDVLKIVDRSRIIGKRDYAILLLLLAYGLRAREVAGLTVDNLDWKRERLRVPNRKGGHSHVYPLTAPVGEALIEYLRQGRPSTTDRHVFFQTKAPYAPLRSYDISHRAAHYLRLAGIEVRRPGSHTLRHTCVQRLVNAGFSLKTIGDFVGHREPQTTQIYGKVAIEPLRGVALARGEGAL